jgi:hypothetical protein
VFPRISCITLESLRESQRFDLADSIKTIKEYIRCCVLDLEELAKWQSDTEPKRYADRRIHLSATIHREIKEAEEQIARNHLRVRQLMRKDVIPVLPEFPPQKPRCVHTPQKRRSAPSNEGIMTPLELTNDMKVCQQAIVETTGSG